MSQLAKHPSSLYPLYWPSTFSPDVNQDNYKLVRKQSLSPRCTTCTPGPACPLSWLFGPSIRLPPLHSQIPVLFYSKPSKSPPSLPSDVSRLGLHNRAASTCTFLAQGAGTMGGAESRRGIPELTRASPRGRPRQRPEATGWSVQVHMRLGIHPIERVGSWVVFDQEVKTSLLAFLIHLSSIAVGLQPPPSPPTARPRKSRQVFPSSPHAPAGMRVMSRSNRPFPVPLPCPLRPPGPAPRPCRVLKTPFLRKPGFRTKKEESGAPSSWLRSAHNTCPSHPVETAGPRAAQPRAQSDGAFSPF